DLMVVVGGRSSANTKELTRLVGIAGKPAIQIESWKDLEDASVFDGREVVGITGGTSPPIEDPPPLPPPPPHIPPTPPAPPPAAAAPAAGAAGEAVAGAATPAGRTTSLPTFVHEGSTPATGAA